MRAGDATRTMAPGIRAPCASFTVQTSVPVRSCACAPHADRASTATVASARRAVRAVEAGRRRVLIGRPGLWSIRAPARSGANRDPVHRITRSRRDELDVVDLAGLGLDPRHLPREAQGDIEGRAPSG